MSQKGQERNITKMDAAEYMRLLKNLTPLEALEQLRQNNVDDAHYFDEDLLSIIEDALKDYEKEIEILEILNKYSWVRSNKTLIIALDCMNNNELEIIESWLKVRILRYKKGA